MTNIYKRIKGLPWICILIVAAAFVVFSGLTCDAQEKEKGLKVTILLFSGRPNPTYVLDDAESIAKLREMMGSAKANESFDKKTVQPGILGYNGIMVENLNMSVAEFPSSLMVYKGDVEVDEKRKMFLMDEGNAIESFLIGKAREMKVLDDKAMQFMRM